MKVIYFFIIGALILLAFYGLNYETPTESFVVEELTQDQIHTLIQLGVIEVQPTLPENSKDIYTEMIYTTPKGNCFLYRDIFGRFYCRW
ncbi:MAG: hypothetical protein ACTSQ4_02390 [Candidatus Heimdallarchaeaceae archaeon]